MANVITPAKAETGNRTDPATSATRPRISERQIQAVVQAAYILDAVRR